MRAFMERLASRFLAFIRRPDRPAVQPHAAYASRLAAEVARLRDRVYAGKTAHRRTRERSARVRARVRDVEQTLRDRRVASRRLRSVAVDTRHLRAALPLRAAALRAVAACPLPDRVGPDQAAAARAWASGERPADVRQVAVDGLVWSIPSDRDGRGRLSSRLERGWLPLSDIADVRPLAVGGVMLDVGANIGTTSIPRVVLGDFERVYAAEPESANYACLVGNIIDNGVDGRVFADRIAITSWDGVAHLQRAGGMGAHRLIATAKADAPASAEVPCLTLDTWLDRLQVPPAAVTFVKIDTQGWDVHVLKGAAGLLARRHVVWQLELSPMMKRGGSTGEELGALVAAHFTHLKEIGRPPVPVESRDQVTARLAGWLARGGFTNVLLFNRR